MLNLSIPSAGMGVGPSVAGMVVCMDLDSGTRRPVTEIETKCLVVQLRVEQIE